MKILMFGWEFPPNISGGLGTASYGLAKGLLSFNDINLSFVVPRAFGNELNPGMKLIDAGGVKLSTAMMARQKKRFETKLSTLSQQVSGYITPELYEKLITEQEKQVKKIRGSSPRLKLSGQYGTSLLEEVSWYGLLASEIAGTEAHDIIHAHDWLTYEAGIEAKKKSGKPLIVHVHATEFDRSGEHYNEHIFEIERRGMMQADKIITVSNFTRNIVINRYKIDPLKVVTVYNGVESMSNEKTRELCRKHIDDQIVTFLGRITWQKGPEYFVEAAYKVLQRMKNVRFIMAGSGDLQQHIVRYAAKLKIADKFHFTGFLKATDVCKIMSISDLYIMPSVSEPFGISVLEAIQSNVPVIISKQSGVSEVIRHAIKTDFWDTDAMADSIYAVLKYPALAEHLKYNGLQDAEKLTWIEAASRVRQIYQQIDYRKAG
jgi:glycogen(starch) synthase